MNGVGLLVTIVLITLTTIICLLSYLLTSLRRKLTDAQERLDDHEGKYRWETGCATLYRQGETVAYKLFTFDYGITWYAVDVDTKKVLGLAEDVYPGLRRHLFSVGTLTRYIEKGGCHSLTRALNTRLNC